jgi:hypothetical protein
VVQTVDISQFSTKRQSNVRFVLRSELVSGDLAVPIVNGLTRSKTASLDHTKFAAGIVPFHRHINV